MTQDALQPSHIALDKTFGPLLARQGVTNNITPKVTCGNRPTLRTPNGNPKLLGEGCGLPHAPRLGSDSTLRCMLSMAKPDGLDPPTLGPPGGTCGIVWHCPQHVKGLDGGLFRALSDNPTPQSLATRNITMLPHSIVCPKNLRPMRYGYGVLTPLLASHLRTMQNTGAVRHHRVAVRVCSARSSCLILRV